MVSYYRPELGLPEMGLVGTQLWQQSGLEPTDIQTAILYDHFTPFTLIQLEELGFCGRGEAKDYVADGAIEIGGRLPINTHVCESGARRRPRAGRCRHRRADLRFDTWVARTASNHLQVCVKSVTTVASLCG
jgi:hypothetical protein